MLGKPGLWPALVLNTVLRKPGRQLPLAGVREPEEIDVPELAKLLEDPCEPEAALLGPALLVLMVDDGETRFSPALVGWRGAFSSVPEVEAPFPEDNLQGDALLPAATIRTR